MKRILSLFLVLTMLCSLCTVFAQEEVPAEETAAGEEIVETAPVEPAAEETAAEQAEAAESAAEESPAEEPEEAPAEESAAEEQAEEPAADPEEAPIADGEDEEEDERDGVITPGSYTTGEGEYHNYLFTPEVSGVYVIYSTGDGMDTVVELYEKNSYDDGYSKVAENDDASEEDSNFLLGYYMTAGVEYSFEISGEEDGYVPFTLTAGYAVRYDANGGTDAPALQGKAPGVALTLTEDQPSRGGCSFVGWAESDSAAEPDYLPGDSYTADRNVTLYAVWQAADTSGSCGADGDNVTWSIDTATNVLTIRGTGMMDDVAEDAVPWYLFRSVITAVHIEEGVTYIGLYAFSGCSAATEVTIPASVTSVCFNAMKGCAGEIKYAGSKEAWAGVDIKGSGLEGRSVTCLDGVTAGWSFAAGVLTVRGTGAMSDYTYDDDQPWNCFKDSITSVVIENGITGIGSYAFYKFGNLTSVVIPEGVTSIGESAFERCGKLADISLPDSLTDIGESAFCWCSSLKDITIPSAVTGIGEFAFQYSGLTSIVLPEGLTTIGRYAFDSCSLTGIVIPAAVTSIGDGAFRGCSGLTSIVIPDTVTSLGTRELFSGCSGLTGVILPNCLTSIGYEMFKNCGSLTGVTIPAGVMSVGDYAFLGCGKLASITIPAGVTSIGTRAFEGCDSLTVDYEGTRTQWAQVSQDCLSSFCITCMDGYAGTGWNFADGVLTITVRGAMPDYTADSAPYESLKSEITSIEIGTGVTGIGSYAFCGCTGIGLVTVPEGVTSIGSYAFSGCTGLGSVQFPESLTYIGDYAFSGSTPSVSYDGTKAQWAQITRGVGSLNPKSVRCSDGDIELTWSVDENGVLTVSGAGSMPEYEKTGPWYADYGDKITSIVIESGITGISSNAFCQLADAVSVTIPATVMYIDDNAFGGCSALTDVYYGGSKAAWQTAVTVDDVLIGSASVHTACTITYDATYGSGAPAAQTGYTGTELTLSSVVPSHWRYKFLGWTDGTDMIQAGSTYTAADEAVTLKAVWGLTGTCGADGDNLTWTLNYDSHVLSITGDGAMADYSNSSTPWYDYKDSVKSIEIGSGVTSIGPGAFCRCGNLVSVTIPAGVTSIGIGAFYGCSSLQSFEVEAGNTKYTAADGVLFSSDMTELVVCPGGASGTYTIPESVTVIGEYAFAGCAKLTAVTIPAGVTEIGKGAFYDCDRLTGVTLPEGLTVLRESVFEECDKLADITIPAGVTSIESGAFAECASLKAIVIPDTVETMGYSVFWMCTSLESVTLPAGLTAIAYGMFDDCFRLTSVTIPSGVTSIGDYAFESCGIEEISIPIGVTSIGESAFADCDDLKDVYYAGSETGRNAITIGGSNDKLLNAAWHYAMYTITYDANGGEGAPEALTVSVGQAVTLNSAVPTRSSCTFLGWAETNNAAEAAWQPGESYRNDNSVTLYAVWKADPITVVSSRTYTANITQGIGAVWYRFTPTVSKTYVLYTTGTDDVKITLYDADGRTLATGTDGRLAYPMTANAVYYYTVGYADADRTGSIELKLGRVYTVKFNANGGTGAPAAQTRDYGSTLTLTGEKPVRPGYDFVGWSMYTTTEEPDYLPGGAYTGNYNVTLYAVWKPASGTCGTDLTWTMDEEGKLTVSYVGTGTGAAIDSGSAWDSHKSAITGVILGSGVTGIGASAFSGCSALTDVTIPTSVMAIDAAAFDGCGSLAEIRFCGTKEQWTAFGVTVPDGCPVQYEAHQWDEGTVIEEASFTETGIMRYTCLICGTTKDETIPRQGTMSGDCGDTMTWTLDAEGLLTISGTGTMYDYAGDEDAPWKEYEDYIYTAAIEDGVESIGAYAFWSLDKLTDITIPESVQAIGRGAFKECLRLQSVVIPSGVTVIESDTFDYCWGYDPGGLRSVTIPVSVKEIRENAFGECYDLENVYYGGSTADRAALTIADGNEYLTGDGEEDDAVWHYALNAVSYDAKCGENVPAPTDFTAGETVMLSTVEPTREGYVFLGWAADSTAVKVDYAAGASIAPVGDMTLYAVWISPVSLTGGRSYTAKVEEAGSTAWYAFTPATGKTYVLHSTGGDEVKITLYSAGGTALATAVDGRLAYPMKGSTTYYYAVSYVNGNTTGSIALEFGREYTVKYKATGGSGAPAAQTWDYGTTLTIAETVPVRPGYSFLGWSVSSTAQSAAYAPGAEYGVNGNATLYAVWAYNTQPIKAIGRYTANIENAGGTVYYEYTPTAGRTYVLYTADKNAEIALYDADGNVLVPGGSRAAYAMTAGQTYLFAVSLSDATAAGSVKVTFGRVYTVRYKANGGTGAPAAQEHDYGTALTLSNTIPVREGYTFLGWAVSSSAEEAAYEAGEAYTANGNVTLYAVWEKNP